MLPRFSGRERPSIEATLSAASVSFRRIEGELFQ